MPPKKKPTKKISKSRAAFDLCHLEDLVIEDARVFAKVPLQAELADVLRRARYRFRVLRGGPRADHALLLNLTYWNVMAGGDVLASARIPADVVAHVAWHHLAHGALARAGKPSSDALFLGEAIASAYDLFLVGTLLRTSGGRRSSFLDSQVPRMAEVAQAAGLSARGFEELLGQVAGDPAHAFGALRSLLFETTDALFRAKDGEAAARILAEAEARPFGALLHHYELSNWVLYARAYGSSRVDARARAADRALREAYDPVAWLATHWVAPALEG